MKIPLIIIAVLLIVGLFYFANNQLDIGNNPSFARSNPSGLFISPLSLVSCTPQTPYTICYEGIYNYREAHASVKLESLATLQQGNVYKGGYFVGSIHFPARINPSDSRTQRTMYYTANAGSWGALLDNCNDAGCSGMVVNSPHDIILATPSTQFVGCPAYYAHAYDEAPDGDFAWTTTGYGWTGTNCLTLRSVQCYEDVDCGSNQFCNREGSWQEWLCQTRVCENGQTRCSGLAQERCVANAWIVDPQVIGTCGVQCTGSETRCDGTHFNRCVNSFFVDDGEIVGQCSVSENIFVRFFDGLWRSIREFFT